MGDVMALVAVGMLALILVLPVVALVAFARASRALDELQELRARVDALGRRAAAEAARAEPSLAPSVSGGPGPAPEPPPRPAAAPIAGLPPRPAPAAPPPAPPRAAAPARPSPADQGADFVTTLGPKILVGAGGLAVVFFLAFFVRYAWENDWVGPAGRVATGAVLSLGLIVAGLRTLERQYRPLGQGLAAAGFAGLYVTAFGAHSVYGLLPRAAAALFMTAVVACAVFVAERLDTRLLAGLAWVGGYLAPVLLSTGEDRAASLFAYLFVLGAGAVWLDRRKPWGETTPLALAGTLLLYEAWYAEHFRPERFGVAAAGLVALTALFAAGTARKERPWWHGVTLLGAVLGLCQLAARADRPEVLALLSLGLAFAALRTAAAMGWGVALVAAAAVAAPFAAWSLAHYRGESLGMAAAWIVGGASLLSLGGPSGVLPAAAMPATSVLAGGIASVALAAQTDRPAALLALLAAQALLGAVLARRWPWSTAASASLGALAVLAWYDRYFRAGRETDALAFGIAVAGLYLVMLIVLGLVSRRDLDVPGAMAHVVAAALAWTILDRVLGRADPRLLGPAAAVLVALHGALGLAARLRGGEPLRERVTLGLATVFLTLGISVQLGLNGITLAWALEGILLVWLGVGHRAPLARAFGYGVLALAVVRLVARHLPLDAGPFSPVFNPTFGVWLAVIVALGAAHAVLRRLPERDAVDWLDGAASLLLAPLGLLLLFGLLTGETHAAFDRAFRTARAAGDEAAALAAERQGGVALSVLWTAFATGLLASGLGLRSRPLFYAAYGLFALTAGKVVLVDLATLPTLYRMLSFLALGVLLLAGAWLNLRFRERLAAPGAAP
jgi:uncharacterized membrane protein